MYQRVTAAVLAVAIGILVAPSAAHAGGVSFTGVQCGNGIAINWSDRHGLATSPQDPPIDVWSMVVDSVTVNGQAVGFTTVDGLNAVTAPIAATGQVTVEIMVHWHAERPNGTSYDAPSVPRSGTVTCADAPASTTTTTTVETSTSVASGGVTLPPSTAAPTTTRNVLDVSLPETGVSSGRQVALATAVLVAGLAAIGVARRRRVA